MTLTGSEIIFIHPAMQEVLYWIYTAPAVIRPPLPSPGETDKSVAIAERRDV